MDTLSTLSFAASLAAAKRCSLRGARLFWCYTCSCRFLCWLLWRRVTWGRWRTYRRDYSRHTWTFAIHCSYSIKHSLKASWRVLIRRWYQMLSNHRIRPVDRRTALNCIPSCIRNRRPRQHHIIRAISLCRECGYRWGRIWRAGTYDE